MDTKLLKQKILDLAIRGKLVPQDPNDEPASVLLERIRVEREKLIAEGKLKRTKNTSDNRQYENVPFEIPECWEWQTLGDIGKWQAGGTPNRGHKEYYGGDIPWLKTGDLNDGYITKIPEHITLAGLENSSAKLNPKDSVLVALYGATIGKVGILTFPATTNQACCACVDYPSLDKLYLFYFLRQHRSVFVSQGGGGAQPNISKEIITATLIPVPPYEEQKRIVEEIERWFVLIDNLEETKNDLQDTIKQTKNKILDLAIHGKLVEQDPNDVSASELLKRIAPNAKPSDTSHYEKNSFKIPEGWIWVCLEQVADIARGGSPRPIKSYLTNDENGINWIKIGDAEKGEKYINHCEQRIKPEGVKSSRFVHRGDFLLTNSMSYGRPYILNIEGCIHDGWLVISPKDGIYDKEFLYYLLSSDFAYEKFSGQASGTTVSNLNIDRVASALFPIAPLEEQRRIVMKIEEVFSYIDAITAEL